MSDVRAVTGNVAASIGAALCRPDVIAAYPITPQSAVVEYLAQMIADGKLDSTMVQVESEHAAMNLVMGAAAAGGRVFTASSAQGLALMYEPYFRMSTLRFPMVMAIASRDMTSPETIWSGQQDTMSVRDSGWMQVYVENNQEIMDMVIQGFRLAEEKEILIPVTVCYDGFYLSHLTERVDVPDADKMKEFLPPYKARTVLDPNSPIALDPLTPGPIFWRYRANHLRAMQKALTKIDEVNNEFAKMFGRNWGGAIQTYRCEDAEIVITTIGSMTGTAREAVDAARENGIKVGLLKVRYMRPFPAQQVAEVLKGKRAWTAVDRSVNFGWNAGSVYVEAKAAIGDNTPVGFSVIAGLGGADIAIHDFYKVIELLNSDEGSRRVETLWLGEN